MPMILTGLIAGCEPDVQVRPAAPPIVEAAPPVDVAPPQPTVARAVAVPERSEPAPAEPGPARLVVARPGHSLAIVRVVRRFAPKHGYGCGVIHVVRAFEVELESQSAGPALPQHFVFVVSCGGGGIDAGARLAIDVTSERRPRQPRPQGDRKIPKHLERRYGRYERL